MKDCFLNLFLHFGKLNISPVMNYRGNIFLEQLEEIGGTFPIVMHTEHETADFEFDI